MPPSRSLSLIRAVSSAILLLAPLACARGSSARNPFAGSGRGREGSIDVRIENQNFGDATIHALRGGERIRLGQVTGKSQQDFKVNWRFSVPIEFRVDLVGGQGCGVRPMTVDPGDKVWLRIPTQIGITPCYAGKG
jgi:hypothetical protein